MLFSSICVVSNVKSLVSPGIYVAIVLAVYLVLLTILLCRYARKHRSSTDESSHSHHHHHHHQQPLPSSESKKCCCAGGPLATLRRLCSCFSPRSGDCTELSTNRPFEEPQNYPMETIELKSPPPLLVVSPSFSPSPNSRSEAIKHGASGPVDV